eukprot:scaffold7429_cov48-Cyclotella_meneghiniana.AAC.2
MASGLTLSQKKALLYAPKIFAICSILSSIYLFYYLLYLHPEKRERIYHRLVLAVNVCIFLFSICVLWGSWALGNNISCSIAGALYIFSGLPLAAYYASLSMYGLIAVKNDFRQEMIQWMEKWIHLWAWTPPIVMLTAMLIQMITKPDINPFCVELQLEFQLQDEEDEDLFWTFYTYGILIKLNFVIGLVTIMYLVFNFSKIQSIADKSTGMKRMIESARQIRQKDVTIQAGLYLLLLLGGYLVPIISWDAIIFSSEPWCSFFIAAICMSASQGVTFTVIYFSLLKPDVQLVDITTLNPTVSQMREYAEMPIERKPKKQSRFSFHVFDGTPAADSPWAQYFEDYTIGDRESLVSQTQGTEDEKDLSTATQEIDNEKQLSTRLLSD